jgi:hypothetical protein
MPLFGSIDAPPGISPDDCNLVNDPFSAAPSLDIADDAAPNRLPLFNALWPDISTIGIHIPLAILLFIC